MAALKQPGGWFFMIGPEGMGKSTLLDQVLLELQQQALQTVKLDFLFMEDETFKNTKSLLMRFCSDISDELDLPNAMVDYWDEACGSLRNATTYLEKHVLRNRTTPVILALEDFDQIFKHRAIADDFCKLLVNWHRRASTCEIWSLLRVVLLTNENILLKTDINYSPLMGVGIQESIPEFNQIQILCIIEKYGLKLDDLDIQNLINLIGGYPVFWSLALEFLKEQNNNISLLLEIATTSDFPFGTYLKHKFERLKKEPGCWQDFRRVVESDASIKLDDFAYKLEGMALIKREGNGWVNCYELCRLYFLEKFF